MYRDIVLNKYNLFSIKISKVVLPIVATHFFHINTRARKRA